MIFSSILCTSDQKPDSNVNISCLSHLITGFCLVLVNCTSPLRTELMNLSTSSAVISLFNMANFPFRGLYANSNLSDDLNPDFSNAFKNAGCLFASKRVYVTESPAPDAAFLCLENDF